MTVVKSTTPGKLKLLVVDATCNQRKFEHEMTDNIISNIDDGILANSKALKPNSFSEVIDCLDNNTNDYNALLYIAHGCGLKNNNIASIQAADMVTNWYLLDNTDIKLENKFVALCVCEGYCDDMLNTLIKGQLFALSVIAPSDNITKSEAISFFPEFYNRLVGLSPGSINPQCAKLCLDECNHLTNNKMRMYPDSLTY